MLRLAFPDADVFLLVPQYRDCHALTFYAFAVEKNGGAAYPLAFVTADGTLDNSYYVPGAEPEIRDGRLVLSTTEGPGGETPEGGQARLFRLDLASRTFIQEAAASGNAEKILGQTADEADTTFRNDEIGYEAIVYYRVLDDGTLGATLFGRVSITEFPVKVEVRYGADLKVEVVGLSENA